MLNRWCTCLLILLSSASFADAKSNPASTAHKNVPARALVFTASERDKVEYLQSAVTWIRENNRKRAEPALRDVAKHAHTVGLVRLEAEVHRVLAMHDPASGAALLAQEKYAEAIPDLEEDSANPLSLRLLWKAYGSTGGGTQVEGVAAKLAAMSQPTVEQALVVPQYRASPVSHPGQP